MLRSFIAASVLALALVASALSAGTIAPVTTAAWKAVLNEWLMHATFAKPHTCAAAVVARTHAPPAYKEGSPLVHALDLYERTLCASSGTPWTVVVGMSDTQVAQVAGAPVPSLSRPNCWTYRYTGAPPAPPGVLSNGWVVAPPGIVGPGARICFTTQGYVDVIQPVARRPHTQGVASIANRGDGE